MSNNYNLDVHLRLLTIISLLTEIEDGMTINELSDRLSVSQSTIINDLRNLQSIAEFNMSIGPADWNLDEYWQDRDEGVHEEEDNEFLLALYDGARNDVPLKIVCMKRDEEFSVELTAFERMILSEYLKNHNMDRIIPNRKDIYVKNMSKPNYAIYSKLAIINDVIRENKALEIKVINEYSHVRNDCFIYPLKIVGLFSDSEYYLLSICNNESVIYNIEYIEELRVSEKYFDVPFDICNRVLAEYDYRWGTGINDGVFDFELKIYNEADIINRLSKKLSSRKYGVWENYGEYAIYKDKVIDYNALKQWVMSYGSSVKVIKPQRLADDIVKSAEERLKKYKALMNSTFEV